MGNRTQAKLIPRPLVAICMLSSFSMLAHAGADTQVDADLVESLQKQQDAREQVMQEGLPGLAPEEIKTLRKLVNAQEAARNNPEPPSVTNQVSMLKRGESPVIQIMERFDTTVMFTDRHGSPIEITTWRINDQEAAKLVPIHSQDMPTGVPDAGADDSDLVMPDSDAAESGEGPVKALIITPESAMRSTNITAMLKGQSHPIVLTVSTRSSLNTGSELAYLQELRLSWVSNMNSAQEAAGKFSGSSGDTSLTGAMLSLVQGIPTDNMVAKELEGPLENQVSLWHDEVEDVWFLRMAEHIEPWNVSIADRTRDGLRGYTVAELNGAPPRLLDVSANGRFSSLTLKGE